VLAGGTSVVIDDLMSTFLLLARLNHLLNKSEM